MKYSEKEKDFTANFADLFTESRDAPLYHWMRTDKALDVFRKDKMSAGWMHINPISGRVMYGNSFSRNPLLDISFPIRLTIDQRVLSRTNKIVPVDGDNVYVFTNSIKGRTDITGLDVDFYDLTSDEMKELLKHNQAIDPNVVNKYRSVHRNIRTRGKALADFQYDEEFIIGDIRNFHRVLLRIEVVLSRLYGSEEVKLINLVREYAQKYDIPLKTKNLFQSVKKDLSDTRKKSLQKKWKKIGEERESDLQDISKFNLSDDEFEERVIFWILGIQNKILAASEATYKFMKYINGFEYGPFNAIKRKFSSPGEIEELLHNIGVEQSKQRAMLIWSAANSEVNLKFDSSDRLKLCIKGFSSETAKCFVIHSRKTEKYDGLDAHILEWLRNLGFENIPKNIPQDPKTYGSIESIFESEAKRRGMTSAELDLKVWKFTSRKKMLKEGRKVVKPVIAFHGTSDKFLPSILKHGLLPNPSEKVWDEGYYESYGGVYLTNIFERAEGTAVETTGFVGGTAPVVIKVQITLPTTIQDEDNISYLVKETISHILSSSVKSVNTRSKEDQEMILNNLVDYFMKNYEGKSKRGTKGLVRELFKLIITSAALDYEYFFSPYGWYIKNPKLQKRYRELVDKITHSAINYNNYETRISNMRLKKPIGFRGRNRIIAIYKMNRYDWEQVYP